VSHHVVIIISGSPFRGRQGSRGGDSTQRRLNRRRARCGGFRKDVFLAGRETDTEFNGIVHEVRGERLFSAGGFRVDRFSQFWPFLAVRRSELRFLALYP
jgi:hypothetical protein